MRRYSMSKKELRQAELFVQVKNGGITLKKAIEHSADCADVPPRPAR